VTEHARQPRTLHRIREPGIVGQHIRRQAMLAPQMVVDVLVRRVDRRRINLQSHLERCAELRRVVRGGAVGIIGRRQQFRHAPHRFAILAPVCIQRPARQLLSWIYRIPSAARTPAPRVRAVGASAGRPDAACRYSR
jgi:hypothetical protein